MLILFGERKRATMNIVEEKITRIKKWLDHIDFEYEHPGYAKDLYKELDNIQNEYNNLQKNILEEINTPRTMIPKDWVPSVCPRCKERFSEYEECDDGYYHRAYSLERCPYCGQKIKWE